MEFINFNDFSVKERHEIIKAFLIKMRKANSMESAHRFFEYYLKQFYKMPTKLIDDIIYCQRAMKSYLNVHQRITNFFGRKTDADFHSKDNHLLEIEDVLHEINAECQYLVLCLEEDIERFCFPFTEQQLHPNSNLINLMVSQAIVPQISASALPFKPHLVTERPTESQLWRKYFNNRSSKDTMTTLNAKDESAKPTRIVAPNKKPLATAATTAARPPAAAKRATIPNPIQSQRIASRNEDVVNASRLHLQEVLKRARLSQNAKCEPKAENSKELFLQSFGLCTHLEHKNRLLTRTLSHKRRPKLTQKFTAAKGSL